MSMNIYVNGRFMTQRLSGVQRFAREITRKMRQIAAHTPASMPRILVPSGNLTQPEADLPAIHCGRLHGQLWEQVELPRHVDDGILVNLGNTAPLLGRPQIVVVHDAGIFSYPTAYSTKFRLWNMALLHGLRRTATHFVTVSEFSRRELQARLHLPHHRVSVITEGADHILSTPPDMSILERHHIIPGRFVLAVGNLAPHKNLQGLSKLARSLAARGIDLVVTGGLNATVFSESDTASSLPVPAKYIGRVNDTELRALYQAALCFVFPSFYEGFGLPPIEAMACECPVAVSAIPSLQEVCGLAATYFDPASQDDIDRAVLHVIDNPALRAHLRSAGRSHAASFTWEHAARQLMGVIGQQLAYGPPRYATLH
ncbi:glycosyltransferase family 4 protein [Gluconacetobacter tumulisoli]|uniref:Glycosyltransferase family 4 protein n=2 Tax=Gluconacetobacter tumulisoli TaxID=1286189 RepID=A0A7W4K4H5_9PROT|nr:glycosyltransferase family 4 protein [Gluconacetobacter tumulisoli]